MIKHTCSGGKREILIIGLEFWALDSHWNARGLSWNRDKIKIWNFLGYDVQGEVESMEMIQWN